MRERDSERATKRWRKGRQKMVEKIKQKKKILHFTHKPTLTYRETKSNNLGTLDLNLNFSKFVFCVFVWFFTIYNLNISHYTPYYYSSSLSLDLLKHFFGCQQTKKTI